MRQSSGLNLLSVLTVFMYAYPVFSFFVFLSGVLMFITMALSFGALNEQWEKRCARLLVFSIIPVCVWMVYFYKPFFSPLLITVIIWLFFPLLFIIKKVKNKIQKNIQQAKIPGWQCKQCKAFNEDVFLV